MTVFSLFCQFCSFSYATQLLTCLLVMLHCLLGLKIFISLVRINLMVILLSFLCLKVFVQSHILQLVGLWHYKTFSPS